MSGSPFSLRPWPTGDKKPKNLGEFIARVNAEPGGFRSVTEDKLREDIKIQEETAGDENADASSSEEDEEENNDGETKDAIAARDEFLRNCDNAHQSAMLALDAISLLLSKEMPVQAGTTLSPALRDAVGIGTLGASRLHDTNVTDARTKNDLAVATGWRVMGLNKMVDSVMAAAERLEKEMELEAKYWADVLAVSDAGWAVCSPPQDPHTLSVRFGFSEAAAEYRDNSLAPLRRQDDGTVRLEHSRVGQGSQRLKAAIERKGVVTACSNIPRRIPDEAPLPDRVLEARNTVFSQELWYELNREARTLLSYGVQTTDTEVTYEVSPNTRIILTLEDLVDEDQQPGEHQNSADRELADSIIMVLHFLLSYVHRQNYRTRTSPSSTTSSKSSNSITTPPYALLRPLIARTRHIATTDALTYFLDDLVSTLQRAGITSAGYTKIAQPITLLPAQEAQVRRSSKSEMLSYNLIFAMDLQVEITLTEKSRVNIRGRTFMGPYIGQQLRVTLQSPPPPAAAAPSVTPADGSSEAVSKLSLNPNPLEKAYPPAGEPYPDLPSLVTYLRNAALRAVAHDLASVSADISCTEGYSGPELSADHGSREMKLMFSDQGVQGQGQGQGKQQGQGQGLMLSCVGQWHLMPGETSITTRRSESWSWSASGSDSDGNIKKESGVVADDAKSMNHNSNTLQEVVRDILGRAVDAEKGIKNGDHSMDVK